MKRTFLLLMSAAALIVVFSIMVFAWQATTATTWDGYGWQAHDSPGVQATSTSAYVLACAPYYSGQELCGNREAIAYRSSDDHFMQNALCTGNNSCTAKASWTAVVGTSYYVQAYQSRFSASGCGPTNAKIISTDTNCGGTSPGGP